MYTAQYIYGLQESRRDLCTSWKVSSEDAGWGGLNTGNPSDKQADLQGTRPDQSQYRTPNSTHKQADSSMHVEIKPTVYNPWPMSAYVCAWLNQVCEE